MNFKPIKECPKEPGRSYILGVRLSNGALVFVEGLITSNGCWFVYDAFSEGGKYRVDPDKVKCFAEVTLSDEGNWHY